MGGVRSSLVAARAMLLVLGGFTAAVVLARLARSGNSLASRKLPRRRLGSATALDSSPRAGAGIRLGGGRAQPPGRIDLWGAGCNCAPFSLCACRQYYYYYYYTLFQPLKARCVSAALQ